MNYQEFASAQLKKKGYKLTGPRQLLADELEHHNEPLSPYELQKLLKQEHRQMDIVTMYRILNLFVELGVVHRIQNLNKYYRCQTFSRDTCHHHVICEKCGTVQEFVTQEEETFSIPPIRQLNFKITHHSLTLFGLCEKCQ